MSGKDIVEDDFCERIDDFMKARETYRSVQYGAYECGMCGHLWVRLATSHVCACKLVPAPELSEQEQKEEAYLRWAREFKPEWLPAAMGEADMEEKEQADVNITDYLNSVHPQLFDALVQTRNEQSNDVRAEKIKQILLASRTGK